MYLVSRTETFAKLFFIVSFTGLFMYVALAFYSFHTAYSTVSQISGDDRNKIRDVPVERFTKDLKYILMWQLRNDSNLEDGQAIFINSNCANINCYITANRTILHGNYTNFDAIIFDASVEKWFRRSLPLYRSPHQKYVFLSTIAAEEHPICSLHLNNFFNWTWTYKLTSDINAHPIEVKDFNGRVIAPSLNVVWPKIASSTNSVDNIDEVNTKTKALVWIMKKCGNRKSHFMLSIKRLRQAMEEQALVFDVYGCGHMKCPKEGCPLIIERDYYFYLAYEDSIASDYVTDIVLDAYQHDAVPVVVGGADYTKFLPDNSYINFQGFTEESLAGFISFVLKTPSKYLEYFNWKKRYTIESVDPGQGLCQLCSFLNDKNKFETYSSYKDFKTWWNSGAMKSRKCIPKGAEKFEDFESYINSTETKT